MLNFNPKPAPLCKYCGKTKLQHKAATFNCPRGRGRFPNFLPNQVFEPKQNLIEGANTHGED